jgi:hypothetical protein
MIDKLKHLCLINDLLLKGHLRFFLLVLFSALSQVTLGQVQPIDITVHGKVREENNLPISNIIIINNRTRTGAFGRNDGSFQIVCHKSDTLTITSLGYNSRRICFKDSIEKPVYSPVIFLEQRTYQLAQVEVFAPRDLEKIQEDIAKLGYRESDYMLSGINAVQSPITFLYQQFSRKEQSRRQVAQFENEDKKRELLKELFHHYVDYQIIDLSDEEFDQFITFINVSDEFLKTSSQYDFLIYVKERFRDYRGWKRKVSHRATDLEYDKD